MDGTKGIWGNPKRKRGQDKRKMNERERSLQGVRSPEQLLDLVGAQEPASARKDDSATAQECGLLPFPLSPWLDRSISPLDPKPYSLLTSTFISQSPGPQILFISIFSCDNPSVRTSHPCFCHPSHSLTRHSSS